MSNISIAINASRARSGGARAHMIGITRNLDQNKHGFSEVHVWSYSKLLDALPNATWLIKHNTKVSEGLMLKQVLWERYQLKSEVRKAECDVLLNVDAGSVCRFYPSITMSRDMLSYEPGEIRRFGFGKSRLRLALLYFIQNASLKSADGVIFLTKYAADIIQRSSGKLENVACIPHGIGNNFRSIQHTLDWPVNGTRSIRCLYVSNTALYKHQWNVVRAIELLRDIGVDVVVELVGGGKGKAMEMLKQQVAISDPNKQFVKQYDFVPQAALPDFLLNADLFIFASSCENMPNTLLEAMASGLPIACSDRGPMPEVLKNGGVYFDPENYESIASAVKQLIDNPTLRNVASQRAKEISCQYSWQRCADETCAFIVNTYKKLRYD